jgi:hypothetical protein
VTVADQTTDHPKVKSLAVRPVTPNTTVDSSPLVH